MSNAEFVKHEGGSTMKLNPSKLKLNPSKQIVHTKPIVHAKDTPLMKLIFVNGFNESTISIFAIEGGLTRLDKLFINEDKVFEVIDELKTINKLGIDEKISTIEIMQKSLNQMVAPFLPDKEKVKNYLILLYRNKIIAREKLRNEKSKK